MSRRDLLGIPKLPQDHITGSINTSGGLVLPFARAGEVALSPSSGVSTATNAATSIMVQNPTSLKYLSVGLVCTGGPVLIGFIGDGSSNGAYLGSDNNGQINATYGALLSVFRTTYDPTTTGSNNPPSNATCVMIHSLTLAGNSFQNTLNVPVGMTGVDLPGPGTFYYTAYIATQGAATAVHATLANARLFAKELS